MGATPWKEVEGRLIVDRERRLRQVRKAPSRMFYNPLPLHQPRNHLRKPGFETLCAHAGEDPSRYEGAVVPPIYQASLFVSPDSETWATRGSDPPKVYDYTRVANPTSDILQTKLAALERTEACRCFGSGNA